MTEKSINKKLLKDFTNGCHDSFCVIYNSYKDKVYFYCFKICKNSDHAKELVQNIFIKLWENRAKIDPKRSIEPYLFTIVRNHTFDFLKSLSVHQLIYLSAEEFDIHSSDTASQYEFTEFKNIASKVIDQLPEMRQVIFKMKFEEGLEVKEIAKLLKLSPNTVKSQLNKASKTVREHLSYYMHISLILIMLG